MAILAPQASLAWVLAATAAAAGAVSSCDTQTHDSVKEGQLLVLPHALAMRMYVCCAHRLLWWVPACAVVFCCERHHHLCIAFGAQRPTLQQGLAVVHTPAGSTYTHQCVMWHTLCTYPKQHTPQILAHPVHTTQRRALSLSNALSTRPRPSQQVTPAPCHKPPRPFLHAPPPAKPPPCLGQLQVCQTNSDKKLLLTTSLQRTQPLQFQAHRQAHKQTLRAPAVQ